MFDFETIDDYANEIFVTKKPNGKRYKLVGKFVGFDGNKYIALITDNMFMDKSYLTFDNFAKRYVLESDNI